MDERFRRPLSTAPRRSDIGTATDTVGVSSSMGGTPAPPPRADVSELMDRPRTRDAIGCANDGCSDDVRRVDDDALEDEYCCARGAGGGGWRYEG